MKLMHSLGLMLLTAGLAEAADVQVKVQSFSSNGECGANPSYDVVETVPLNPVTNTKGESLRVFFNNFVLTTNYPGTANKNCVLDAGVRIPAGYRFRPVSAAAEGSYNLQPAGQTQGFIRVSYEVQPEDWTAEASNGTPFTGQGDINCLAKLEEDRVLSCADEDTDVTLHTNIDLSIRQNGNNFSQMDIDAARQNYDLAWKWELYSCSNLFENRPFKSTYVAYSGQKVDADVSFSGSRGSFKRQGASEGRFYDVTYSNRGRTVQGKWSAGDSKGTFIFTMQNDNSAFQGTWKDAKNSCQGGTWSGRAG